jgi:prolyl oligopeptidase
MTEKFDWEHLSNEANQAFERGEFDRCLEILRRAQRRINKLPRTDPRLAVFSRLTGSCLAHKGEYKSAIPYFKNAVKIYEHNPDPEAIRCLSWSGWCFYQLRLWRQAAKYFQQSIERQQALKIKDEDHMLYALTYAGAALWFSGNRAPALRAFRKAVKAGSEPSASLLNCGFLCELLVDHATGHYGRKPNSPALSKLIAQASKMYEGKLIESKPPETNRANVSDRYFGIVVNDPYRWLESISSPDVQAWLAKQNSYSYQFFRHIPGHKGLTKKVWEFVDKREPHVPRKVGDYYFFQKRPHGRARIQLLRAKRLGQFPTVVLDGNALPEHSDLVEFWLSGNGRYAAYTESKNGSEWQTLRIRDLETGKDRREKLENLIYVHVEWSEDNTGFYYSAISSPKRKQVLQRVFFHKLGTEQAQDRIIYEGRNLDELFGMNIVDGKYLLLSTISTDENHYSLLLKFLKRRKASPVTLLSEQKYTYSYAGSREDSLYFVTNMNASMNRLVAVKVDGRSVSRRKFVEVVPESKELLETAMVFPKFILGFYLTPEGLTLRRLSYKGKLLKETKFPRFATIASNGFGYSDSELFFEIEGYTSPKRIIRYNTKTGELSADASPDSFDSAPYVTKLCYATSRDATRVPVYLTYKRGLKRDGTNPVILTGYGGFGRCSGPGFSPYNMAWMDLGGIFAEAVIRGGGELGWHWRRAGMRREKQNTFDDFIAVARYLIKERYTSARKLGISGGSNGGLLVGAVLAQHPELFGAAVVMTGVLDMLRYHKFNFARHYIGEYGCSTNKKDFQALYGYSPLHRLRPERYPPALILTFANDDRVNPSHSYKFVATLQHSQRGDQPIMLSVESNAGHTGRHDSDWASNSLSFFAYHLGVLPRRLLNVPGRDNC